jgi:hypothetical protein
MQLLSLVYSSTAVRDVDDAMLKEILNTAREKNSQSNITGMLLYRDGTFLQALEGEPDAVDALYARIARDSRHTNITVIHRGQIYARSFTQWAMGFNTISDEDLKRLPGYSNILGSAEDFAGLVARPGQASVLLEAFKDQSYF